MRPIQNYEGVHLRDYLYILKKRRIVIILCTLSVLFFGVLFTFREKVVYRATATIMIEKENPNIVDFKEVMAFDASTTDYYQTQYQMLESRSLIEKLIQDENLDNDTYLTSYKQNRLRRLFKQLQPFIPVWFRGFMTDPALPELFIKKMLQIEPVRNSRLVEVNVLHPDPARAAALANRLTELFIKRNLEERFLISSQATQMLSDQLGELKEKVAKAERNLQAYKEEHGLINIPSMREKDQFIQDAKLELVKTQAEEARLSKRYLPAHPKRISIRSQIEGLDEKIKEEEQKILGLSRDAIQYAEYERESDTARKIYEALLSRFQETQSAAQTQASNVVVVDPAVPPPIPYKPRPMLNMMVALFIGVMGGVLLAFFFEYLDPTIRIPDDIEVSLGLDVLGIIPRVNKSWKTGPAKGELFLSGDKPSTISESFRALRTALLFKLRSLPGCRILLVTSPNPSEGKSTVSLNLASVFHQNNLRVLLVDGDLRKPKIHKLFDLPAEGGMAEVLESGKALKDVVHANVANLGFDFLSCGEHSTRPTEILGSEAMKKLAIEMRNTYDLVVIDSPPFHAVADVAVLNEYADAIVLVVRHHQTHRQHLRDVKKIFIGDKPKMIGVVINHVSLREKDYYYHRYYYYGYGDASGKR
ncbi:MAG: polysaccharide biosynthesis tyrosine autokinase [Candidatus Omnitrophica bacterium]|nr:polysaccharide biosynthesis tyrosine autokinase [Candidatus Omnitrophota bacterium]